MKRSDAFPSQYLGKDDVHSPRIVTIDDVQKATIKGENGEEEKPVMYFRDFPKPMILNNVNWMTVESEYGDDSDLWKGKQIELYHDPNIMFGSKRVGGVRIRIPQTGTVARVGAPSADLWPWTIAVQKCSEAGIDESALKAALKDIGLTSYRAERDTIVVKQLISDRRAGSHFEGQTAVFKEEEIPF